MEKPTQEDLKQQISDYYKSKLSSGLTCKVKSLSMAEVEETDGKNVTATLSFLHDVTGIAEDSRIVIPCDSEGNLDWTNTTFLDEDSPHDVGPDQTSHPTVKSPEPLPANNQKPKDGGGQPPERGKVIQQPKKVGAQGGKKVKAGESKTIKPPPRLGTDELGWPTGDQLDLEEKQEEKHQQSLREGYVHGQDDWDADDITPEVDSFDPGEEDFDVFQEAGVSPAMASQAAVSRLGESQTTSPEGYVHGQDDLEETMKGITPVAIKGEDIPVALVEYRAKSLVEGTTTMLFEFGVLFESQEMRDLAKTAVEAMEGVEDVELIEDIGLAIVCRMDEDITNPATPLKVIEESLGIQMHWEEGEKAKFNKDLTEMSKTTHNYSDNKGEYHTGVQTDPNEPGAANPGGGAQQPGEEQGGPKKRKHAKTDGDEGGDGLGGPKAQSTPSVGPDGKEATKDAGQQATESMIEQDFLDDVMSYDDGEAGAEDETGVDDGMGGEATVELDDTVMSLVAAQAEHGIEIVLQVAREHYETTGEELSPEHEEEIRAMFAEYAQDAGGEEEDDLEVTATEVTVGAEDEDEAPIGGNPFESQQEDVNINVTDGGTADVTATDGGGGEAAPAEPVVPVEPVEPTEPAEGDVVPDEGAETKVDGEEDDEPIEPSEKPGEKDDEEKPSEEESLKVLRDEMVDELIEMEDLEAVLAVEALEIEHLLALDEALPPPGEGGRFKKLKKELGGKGADDPDALASYIGRKKYGKKKMGQMAAAGEAKKPKAKDKKLNEESGLQGQASRVNGWAAGQPAPNQALSFVDNDAYSFAQRIAAKDPVTRKAKVLKPGKFSSTTSRHANMVARNLARQGYEVDRIDVFDNDQGMKVGELNTELSVGLPEESLQQLSGARFKRDAIEKLTDEQKGQLKEKLIARGKKLGEDQQNQNTMGGKSTVQRVRGKDKNYNMFGRLKPNTKWDGMVRVVWDDGDETWEKPGDITNVGSNPYNVRGPSGGPTKPGSQKMSSKGGEELDMLKNIESLKKLPREKRFEKAIEMQAEGKKFDVDQLTALLTEGMDEFENFDAAKLVESIIPKKVETPPAPEPEPIVEDEEDDEPGALHMLVEDFEGNTRVETIVDEDLDEDE